jgi:hypothetical protein
MDYLNGYTIAIGAIALLILAWRMMRAPKKPEDKPLRVEDWPLKTVETRDSKEIPL